MKNQSSLSLTSFAFTRHAMTLWVGIIWLGQWLFAAYIFFQFLQPSLVGNLSAAQFSHMIKGHVAGDSFGNGVLILHVLPVFLLSAAGVLQLIPSIRTRFPTFHRWNGRVFLLLGLAGALTGLYLTWIRDARLSDLGALGITLNGLLIPVAIGFAWHYARARQFAKHRRWAVHAFILVNGVWSLRLLLMGWFMINQGANGNNATMDGPADIIFSYACYLLPMLVAEIYFAAERKKSAVFNGVVNSALMAAIAITLIGTVAAFIMMWWPRISAAI